MNLPRLVRSLIAAGIFAAAVIFYASTHPKLSALRGVPWGPHPRPSRHPHSHLHDTFYVPTNSLTLPRGRVIPNGRPAVINQRGNYIRATKLHDGSLLAAYVASEDVPGGRPQLVLHTSRSTDGAVTWQPWGEVQRAGQDDFDLDNAFPFQIPENAPGGGRLLVAYRKHSLRPGANPLSLGKDRYDHYRLGLSVSDDGGQTFEELSTIVESFADKAPDLNGVWEPFLRLARDGHTLQCYFSSENSGVDQDNFMRTSSDGGRTWSRDWVPVSGLNDPSPSRDGMVNVAPLDNRGNLIAVFENTESDNFAINAVFSPDDGYTWGKRERLYTARNNKHAIAPTVVHVGSSTVVSFMTNEDVDGDGRWSYDGAQMKVIVSTDHAKSWGSSVVLAGKGSHWPGLFAVDATHFLALYSKDGFGAMGHLYKLIPTL